MREQEHRYELYREYRTIKVVPRDETRPIVKARLDECGFWKLTTGLSRDENSIELVEEENFYNNDDWLAPMFRVYNLLYDICEALYASWNPPEEYDMDDIREELMSTFPWNLSTAKLKRLRKQDNIVNWSKMVTRKSISKVFSRMWHEIMDEDFDQLTVKLHKKLFSVSAGSGCWFNLERILEHKNELQYLIQDLLNYPAARISFLHYVTFYGWNLDEIREYDWRNAYLPRNAEPYTSLNKTLMNLPGGVTYHLYFHLRNFTLNEPVKTRLKMYAYLSLHDPAYPHNHVSEKDNVILRSSEETIEEALRYMFHYFPSGNKFDLRRTHKIVELFHTIYDYPGDVGEWDMLGLAKRSEQYHHETRIQREERMRKERELNKKISLSKTALPPIKLPEEDSITLLDSYTEVEEEGRKMKHCIASYADGAVRGRYYLFHIDYNGVMASAQVTPEGYVNQIYGPRDKKNEACVYGKKVLTEWGKKLVEAGSPIKRILSDEEFEKLKEKEPEEETSNKEQLFDDEVIPFPDYRGDEVEVEMEIPF